MVQAQYPSKDNPSNFHATALAESFGHLLAGHMQRSAMPIEWAFLIANQKQTF